MSSVNTEAVCFLMKGYARHINKISGTPSKLYARTIQALNIKINITINIRIKIKIKITRTRTIRTTR